MSSLVLDNKYVAMSSVAVSAGIAAYSFYKLNCGGNEKSNRAPGSEVYESEKLLGEYLVFHFGTPEQLIPYPFGPKDAIDFPKRCADLCLKHYKPQEGVPDRALDIGCAVGRSSFDLSRGVKEVVGLDYSQSFIDAANTLKTKGEMPYKLVMEGDVFTDAVAKVDADVDRSKVSFEQGDACALRESLGGFGVVLAANLVCRLHHPDQFLNRLSSLLPVKGGILVITAPYTWMRDFADKSQWLGGYVGDDGKPVSGFEGLKKALGAAFDLVEDVNMPFFIRETCRKNQWTVAHATVWRRK